MIDFLFSREVVVAAVFGLVLPGMGYLLYQTIRYVGLRIGSPIVENPYGNNDFARDMPRKLRFIRIPISARFFRHRNVSCTMDITDRNGLTMDCPGYLHWQRQPRGGIPHPAELHKALKDERDIIDHMLDFHFSKNEPINIGARRSDKIDLLFRVDGLAESMPTVSRENLLPPGDYRLELHVDSAAIQTPKTKVFYLRLGPDIDDMEEIEAW